MFARQGGAKSMLTQRQREIWEFIVGYVDGHGYPPTVREIGEAVGLASPSTVHAHLANLESAVRLQSDARNGDIVVALAGEDESADDATVKRFFAENGRIRLQPENDALEPIFADHVHVLGKVVGVFRRV